MPSNATYMLHVQIDIHQWGKYAIHMPHMTFLPSMMAPEVVYTDDIVSDGDNTAQLQRPHLDESAKNPSKA